MNIPLIDLKAQYKSIAEDLDRVTKGYFLLQVILWVRM